MGTAFFNREDIKQRLAGTICFYDGLPYYVDAHNGVGNTVCIIKLTDVLVNPSKRMEVDYTSDKFNYKSPALGYFFRDRKEAVYVSRIPDRNQSQGLNPYVLYAESNNGRYWYYTKEFEDMLLNRYDPRTTAEHLLTSGLATSVPISKNVALAHSRRGLLEVMYKGRPVACNFKGRGVELYDITEKNYMAKLLAKDGIMLGA